MRAMAIDRRAFLATGAAAALAPAGSEGGYGQELLVAACREPSGSFSVAACDTERGILARVALPARGHDVAVRPGTRECVVFARRPGTFAVAFRLGDSPRPVAFAAGPRRHFFGHGVFAPGGRVLFSTENDSAAGKGIIGVRDATDGYREIGAFDSGGIGPHDIALLADGRTLVVANGGIDTGGGREPLNIATMEPSLVYLDAATGDILERHALPAALHKLSIRHLAVGIGGTVVFGCQYEGAPDDHPPLVGFHRRGESLALAEAPESLFRPMRNYIGSIAADSAGESVVATSPRGGRALLFDVARRRCIAERSLDDVCGVAPRHAGGGFLLTSGLGVIEAWPRSPVPSAPSRHEAVAWDNHAICVTPR